MGNQEEIRKITRNHQYKKMYYGIVTIRTRLYLTNKKLLNEGKKEKYRDNCNILLGMNKILEKLPKP